MSQQPQHGADFDPFAQVSTPALSFKGDPIGTVKHLKVTAPADWVQSRDFETGNLKTWEDGNPVMSAVLKGETPEGEERSIWAEKPSSMFTAIVNAQKALGRRLQPGDVVAVTFVEEKPNAKNPRLNAQKIYSAVITPGQPPAGADPFGGQAQQAAPAQQQPAAQPAAVNPFTQPAAQPAAGAQASPWTAQPAEDKPPY